MIACSLFVAQSCKKDDDGADTSQQKAHLTAGDWIQVDHQQDGVSDWDTDWDDCEKDDIVPDYRRGIPDSRYIPDR